MKSFELSASCKFVQARHNHALIVTRISKDLTRAYTRTHYIYTYILHRETIREYALKFSSCDLLERPSQWESHTLLYGYGFYVKLAD